MTVTYSNSLSSASDRIRFQLGDTDTTDAMLSDEEIAAVLTLQSDDETAAMLFLAQGLVRRYSRQPVKVSADGASFDYSDRLKVWQDMIAEIKAGSVGGLRVTKLARPTQIVRSDEYGGT